jgi:hypothetical protein
MTVPSMLMFLLDPSVASTTIFHICRDICKAHQLTSQLTFSPSLSYASSFYFKASQSALSSAQFHTSAGENYADNLHQHDRTARLRLAFSVCWTGVLIYSNIKTCWMSSFWNVFSMFKCTANTVMFHINILSIIALLAPYVRLKFRTHLRRESYWGGLEEFNTILDRHHVSTTRICQMHH